MNINIVYAKPYGPTLNEIVLKYNVTRNFDNLKENLSREKIDIRLGMTMSEVEKYAKKSKTYILESKKNSVYKFVPQDENGVTFYNLSFDVIFRNGEVVMIKTHNLNNFEFNEDDVSELKALKKIKINECWTNRNYVDVNSLENGYDFVLLTQLSDSFECMGSDRASITIGSPGLLYPKHILKSSSHSVPVSYTSDLASTCPEKSLDHGTFIAKFTGHDCGDYCY